MTPTTDPDHLRTMLLVLLEYEVPFIVCGGVALVRAIDPPRDKDVADIVTIEKLLEADDGRSR